MSFTDLTINKGVNKDIKLYITDGMIITYNMRVMLKSVAVTEVVSPKPPALDVPLMGVMFGIILIVITKGVVHGLGMLFIILGIIDTLIMILLFKFTPHSLHVNLDSGRTICFRSHDKKFLQEFQRQIVNCARDESARVYIDMKDGYIDNHVTHVEIDRLYEQESNGGSIFNGNIKVGSGNIGKINFGNGTVDSREDKRAKDKIDQRINETNDKSNAEVLSDDEWKILIRHFNQQMLELDEKDPFQKNYQYLKRCSLSKNAEGIKEYITKQNQTTVRNIIGKMPQEVRKLIGMIINT